MNEQAATIAYPTEADLVQLHAAAVEVAESTARRRLQHRDGLLAALERPRWHEHYQEADLVAQASLLAEGLLGCHAWVDGNKRTTWLALRAFLELNRYSWEKRPQSGSVVTHLTNLTTRALTAKEFEEWLRHLVYQEGGRTGPATHISSWASLGLVDREAALRQSFARAAIQFANEDGEILEALAAFDRGEYSPGEP